MSEREDATPYRDRLQRLTPLEIQVLTHRCAEKTTEDIADLMAMPREHVRLLLADIYDRLGLTWQEEMSSFAALTRYCPYVSEVSTSTGEESPDAATTPLQPPPQPSHRALEIVDENDENLRATQATVGAEVIHQAAEQAAPSDAEEAARYTNALARLDPAELDVLRFRCAGRTSDEIAALMSIPAATARHLLADIYDKLGLPWQQETTSLAALNRYCPHIALVAPVGAAAPPHPIPQPLPPQPSQRAFELVSEDDAALLAQRALTAEEAEDARRSARILVLGIVGMLAVVIIALLLLGNSSGEASGTPTASAGSGTPTSEAAIAVATSPTPTVVPTAIPTPLPPTPTVVPTPSPAPSPTPAPTPTLAPTPTPTTEPTPASTQAPTAAPTVAPTALPTPISGTVVFK
ncbi:MAG TPA: hypothetical protein VHA53_04925, partial [Nitrolancea sp.]|nr:hypothetical protein [Nitrolancea sp.]